MHKGVIQQIKPIINIDRTESGKLVFWKDKTVNSIMGRIPIW